MHPTEVTATLRAFDPSVVARLERDAWVAYYRHEWLALLRASIALGRHTFGLSWPMTIRCAWLALRATQLWAPFPHNHPDRARRLTERFYRILQKRYAEPSDPAVAASLELNWWRAHRNNQYSVSGGDEGELVDALVKLYSYVYGISERSTRRAAEERVVALRLSDQWVREGCDLNSLLIDEERAALERSYTALLTGLEGDDAGGARHRTEARVTIGRQARRPRWPPAALDAR